MDKINVNKKIKCVVWDLDNTIWNGTLLEDSSVQLKEGIIDIIITLDERGILQSISSKNDHNTALKKLKEFNIDHYFLYPQINWNSKSTSIEKIKTKLNIGIDTFAFVDDREFELEEVKFNKPEVMCINAEHTNELVGMDELIPRFITNDSQKRREMYQSDIVRNNVEEEYQGATEDFLASLHMVLSISPVDEGDLQRAEELTVRTHQLNTTGYTYSYEELDELRKSNNHILLKAELKDKYGTYGNIGLVLIECNDEIWTLKLLLMSCRVMSRGVGTILINYIMDLASKQNVKLQAEFVSNDKNRMMYITYKFAGFKELIESKGVSILENDLTNIQPFPEYIKVFTTDRKVICVK